MINAVLCITAQVCASVTSSTHERKSKTNAVMSKGKIYLKHNAFQ
jgi:DNA-directed RNA polymerase III subunit RPC2